MLVDSNWNQIIDSSPASLQSCQLLQSTAKSEPAQACWDFALRNRVQLLQRNIEFGVAHSIVKELPFAITY